VSWRDLALGDAIHVRHGFAFKGEHFSSTGELMVVTPGNFLETGGFRVRAGKERYYSGDFPDSYLLKKGDLIVAMTEQGEGLLGSAARIPEDDRYLHNQRLGLVTVTNKQLIDERFLYWIFNSPSCRAQLRGSATGAKVKHTAPERIYKVRSAVPSVETQGRIASLLDAYDDLIVANRRRIVLLEESARLLYREWFVNLRFRGYQLVPLVDGLPEKWRVTTYGDIVDAIGGATPSSKRLDYWNGDVVWLTPTDVTRNDCLYLSDSARRITETGYESCSTKLLPPGTIFMTSRASIGYFALLDQPACTNQGFIAVVPKLPNCRNYLLFNLMNRVDEFNAKATGSTFKELSKRTFRDMTVMLPSQEVLDVFEAVTLPIIEQIKVLKKQLIALTLARDELLPRLMSGAIRV